LTKVKICGIQHPHHAILAAREGADFIGIVFASSRRQVSLPKAQQIVEALRREGLRTPVVGVFADEDASNVNAIAQACPLDWVQLSGHESVDYCRRINLPLLKAVHVPIDGSPEGLAEQLRSQVVEMDSAGYRPLLDSAVPDLYGGTGKAFNWQVAQELAKEFAVLLAGGLTPENVAQAILTVQPWGVDVSSGVETGGQKDSAKIIAFIHNAKG